MALYLVVHHRLAKQIWNNAWRPGNDDLLDAITTTTEIGQECDAARRRGEEVYIHRTGWGDALIAAPSTWSPSSPFPAVATCSSALRTREPPSCRQRSAGHRETTTTRQLRPERSDLAPRFLDVPP